MDDKRYWIGFTLIKGIGAVRFQRLLDRFAWKAAPAELAEAGLSLKLIERLVAMREKVDLSRVLEQIQSKHIQILTWMDEAYPQRLKEIEQPPPVLYLRGMISTEDDWAVAIVGSRRVTPYGRQVTEEIASFLAANGVTVVSGLARGVDARRSRRVDGPWPCWDRASTGFIRRKIVLWLKVYMSGAQF